MIDAQHLGQRYVDTWNETDAATRRRLIDGLWVEDSRQVDPMMQAEGQDRIATLIDGVHSQSPGYRFALAGPADGYGAHVRFTWSLGTAGGQPIAGGTDFAVVAGDGVPGSGSGSGRCLI